MTTLEQFGAAVCERVRADMPTIHDPEGDIQPSVFATVGDTIERIPIPLAFFNSRQGKDLLAAGIAARVRDDRPRMLALTHTVYMLKANVQDLTEEQLRDVAANRVPRGTLAPMDHPDRIEQQHVIAFDDERTLVWTCEITRQTARPPVYGEWEPMDHPAGGLLIEPIQEAMRA
jgi:hypothetical protein